MHVKCIFDNCNSYYTAQWTETTAETIFNVVGCQKGWSTRVNFGVSPAPLLWFMKYNFQYYMFNMESRHLLNLSVQNALDCISENFNLKNFPRGACTQNSLEKCAICSLDRRYHAHIATAYYISRPSVCPWFPR